MSDNPYSPPAAAVLSPANKAIWNKELKSARTILIVAGVLQLLFGLFYITQARSEFDKGVEEEVRKMGPGYVVDRAKMDQAFEENKVLVYTLSCVPAVIGIFFLVMAAIVYRFPVGVTLTSLIVFIVVHVGTAFLDPTAIYKGILLKIIFIVILVKAYKSARAARAVIGS